MGVVLPSIIQRSRDTYDVIYQGAEGKLIISHLNADS